MKFAHLSDCHIGSWKDPKLRNTSTIAFLRAMDSCIEKKVDFILISGDLFDTSLPAMDLLKEVVTKFKELKDKGIPVYVIAGSHDYSPSGKTMIDVIENAGLFTNVCKGTVIDNKLHLKFTVEQKTGAKITGILGKRGQLEKLYYEHLDKEDLEQESGFKIFMFHSGISEFKPEDLAEMDASPLSLLPRGFDYYAGGHIHDVFQKHEKEYGLIAFPGPLFPNNFKELEKLERGGFYMYEDGKLTWEPIQVHAVYKIALDCTNMAPQDVERKIQEQIAKKEFVNTIVTIRLYGQLLSGKPSDINYKDLFEELYHKSAYFIMKNTAKLTSPEFDAVAVEVKSAKEIEDASITEHLGQIKLDGLDVASEKKLVKGLMETLSQERREGERTVDFEKRIKEEVEKVFEELGIENFK